MHRGLLNLILFALLSVAATGITSQKGNLYQYSQMNIQSSNKVKLVCWNSRGLVSALPYLNDLMKSHDIIALSEHWLHSNRLNVLTEISAEFNVVARSSKHAEAGSYGSSRGQGGVALFWRKSLNCITPISNITHDRVCGIRLPLKDGRTLCIYSVYLPSQGSDDDFCTVIDELYNIVYSDSPNDICVLCGDFNGDVGFLGGHKSTRPPTTQGRKVANLFNELSLFPANLDLTTKGPLNTFKGGMGSSTLDYIAVPISFKRKYTSCKVLEENILNVSDHHAVELTLCVEYGVSTSKAGAKYHGIRWGKAKGNGTILKYRDNIDLFLDHIQDHYDLTTCNEDQIDNFCESLSSGILDAGKVLPKASSNFRARPFWNQTLSELKKEKVFHYRAWKAGGAPRHSSDKLWCDYKISKRNFRREIKRVQREHEQRELSNLVEAAKTDKNKFWRIVKRKRSSVQCGSVAIKAKDGTTKYNVEEVVQVWKDHFSNLCTSDSSRIGDEDHHRMVSDAIQSWAIEKDEGFAFTDQLTAKDISEAISALNCGKSPGYDLITTEHLKYGGDKLVAVLTKLYNRILAIEYIPKNFRIGTQIPLFKGKNLCSLDPNNYRGITLLTSFNKLSEIVTWNRIKVWWHDNQVISPLQGACSKGLSCLHTAAILQETIAVGLDTNKKVFVAYFDVAKAFDSVWIDGLFYQLRLMGISGKEWRMLYASYTEFWCKVRLQGVYSDWYPMHCGIHQGGYLSLLKYAAFIDPLLRILEKSSLGSTIEGIPVCPLGYADDMASACVAKRNLDQILSTAFNYSMLWEYKYNAKKSAVMVYGESRNAYKKGAKYRNFMLGRDKVKEPVEYDHVGVKNCLFNDFKPRLEDRLSRGRRSFNAILSSGIKKKGLNMSVISALYWSIVVPVVIYGSEIWNLKGEDIESLRKFQRYVGRKCQRFPQRSAILSAYLPLGWISLEKVVYVKKLLFFRSICQMEDIATCKKVLTVQANKYNTNRAHCMINECNSPMWEIFNVAQRLDLLEVCLNMILNGHFYSKKGWNRMVWEKVWNIEDEEIQIVRGQLRKEKLLLQVLDKPYYLNWWIMTDISRTNIDQYEIMARLVCDTNLLKAYNLRYKGTSIANRFCYSCDLGAEENTNHIVMQCPASE